MSDLFDEHILKLVAESRKVSGYADMDEQQLRDTLGKITKTELMRIDPNMDIGGFPVREVSAEAIKRGRWRTYEEWRNKLY